MCCTLSVGPLLVPIKAQVKCILWTAAHRSEGGCPESVMKPGECRVEVQVMLERAGEGTAASPGAGEGPGARGLPDRLRNWSGRMGGSLSAMVDNLTKGPFSLIASEVGCAWDCILCLYHRLPLLQHFQAELPSLL